MFFLPKPISNVDGFTLEAYVHQRNITNGGVGAHLCKNFFIELKITCSAGAFYGTAGTFVPILMVPLVSNVKPCFTGELVTVPITPDDELCVINLTEETREGHCGVWLNVVTEPEGSEYAEITSFLIREIGTMQ